jgi:hypothetical protein
VSLPLLIPVLCCGGLFAIAAAIRRDPAHPTFWLTLLYFGSCVCSLLVNKDLLRSQGLETLDTDWVALLGYAASIIAFLLPVFFLHNRDSELLAPTIVERIAILSAPFVIFAFVYLLPYAWQGATRGAADVRAELNNLGISLLPVSPLTTLAVIVAQFYALFAVMFVIATARGGTRLARSVCFLGSTLYLLNALCFAARDGFLWFIIAYGWALWYARPLIAPRTLLRLRRVIGPVVLGGMTLFGLFSFQRFGDRAAATTLEYMVAYYGSQPYVFATTVRQQHEFYEGRLRFPLFVDPMEQDQKVLRTLPYEWSFGTFIKDLYAEGGWYLIFACVAVVPGLAILLLVLSSGVNAEAFTLISILYVQFMAQGVFYLRLGMRAGNLYIVCVAILIALSFVLRLNMPRAPRRATS